MARKSAREKIAENLKAQDEGLKWYFSILPELLDKVSTASPALAYSFHLIESAQRMALYALIMREYRTDSELTWSAVDRIDITRKNFPILFQKISGKNLSKSGRSIIEPAEKVRDAIMHGRGKTEAELQEAILRCLEYAEFLNGEFFSKVGFRPFGKLQGVTSKKGVPQLPKKISRLVLDGLLSKISQEKEMPRSVATGQ
jgi:hypothetical protein